MARIRTVKPEFWTDAKIVRLPYEARLLFIGMFNFADDEGYLPYEEDQIQMQIFPGDNVNIAVLLDFLMASELIEVYANESYEIRFIKIKNFGIHQKISHPSKSKISKLCIYKKQVIPLKERLELAKKYDLQPGEHKKCECYYCGHPGMMWWPLTSKGDPGFWVGFSLEIDHFIPEKKGGSNHNENYVLACRFCNRSKGTNDGYGFISRNIHGTFMEDSRNVPLGKERKGKEDIIITQESNNLSYAKTHTTSQSHKKNDYPSEFEEFWKLKPKRDGTDNKHDALKPWNARMREKEDVEVIYKGTKEYASYCERTGIINTFAVMTAARFIGPGKHYLEKWEEKGYGTTNHNRKSTVDKIHDAAENIRRKYCQDKTSTDEVDRDIPDF